MITTKACRHANSAIFSALERDLQDDSRGKDILRSPAVIFHVIRRIKSPNHTGRVLLDQNVRARETENRLTKRTLVVRCDQFEEEGFHIYKHNPDIWRDRAGLRDHLNQILSFNQVQRDEACLGRLQELMHLRRVAQPPRIGIEYFV